MQTRRDVLQSAIAVAAAKALFIKGASAAVTESDKTWGVSSHPHFDRVMAPWAVKRFVDKNAKFVFAPKLEELPKDAIPMGFPTGELSMHDDKGTTFHKVMVKYKIDDPAMLVLDRVNKQAVEWFLHGTPVDMNDRYSRWSFGLLGLSDALLLKGGDGQPVLDLGFPNYDALYDLITVELKKGQATKS
jgi:hypothetical protein